MTTFSGNLQIIRQRLAEKLRQLPPILGEEAVKFSQQSFEQQGWRGQTMQPWKLRKAVNKWGKKDDRSRKILIQTGAGKRSIRVIKIDKYKVWIGAGGGALSYMNAHNTGFRGRITQNVQPFTRKIKKGKKAGTERQVRGFQRTISQNLPKRQFIGGEKDSPYLKARLQRIIKRNLNDLFR